MRWSFALIGLGLILVGGAVADDDLPLPFSRTRPGSFWPELRLKDPARVEGALVRETPRAPNSQSVLTEEAITKAAELKLTIALAALNDIAGQFPDTPAAAKAASALRRVESVPLEAEDRKLALRRAALNGKYRKLLRIVPAEQDFSIYGMFRDFGRYEGTSYLSQEDLPPGYWVYVYPNWYIWGEAE